jgi:flagellar motor protein MotB
MKKMIFYFGLITVMIASSTAVKAEIVGEQKAKNQANNKANSVVDQSIVIRLNAVESGVKNLFLTQASSPTLETTDTQKSALDIQSEPSENQTDTVKTSQPSFQSYSKFDFIPGAKVIFFDDFTETAVGDFPPNWNTNSTGEIVTTNFFPGNWFKMRGSGSIYPDEALKLPDNYTIEFDIIASTEDVGTYASEFGFYLYSAKNPKDLTEGGSAPGLKGGIKMNFGYRSSYGAYDETGYTIEGAKNDAIMEIGKKYHLSFWVQKTRLRVYLDQNKIFDLPKVFKPGFQCNQMRFELWRLSNPMITNFRIAAGLPDTRNKLITEGKLVSYGIYFDVNKDVVKPESYGTLKEISAILNEVPDIKVKIIGHTDADGDDSKNKDLSKRRAASVKAELVKTFGVNADRLEIDGMGESQPVAPNDTPVNKALNRRVEFIKL